MNRLVIEFIVLDDEYKTTQGTAYVNGQFLVTKRGRGEFDVLDKISRFCTDYEIERMLDEYRQ